MKRRVFLAMPMAALGADKLEDDTVLRAMRDELERSRKLRLVENDPPYYIEYALDELNSTSLVATEGAIVSSNENISRIPRVQVRVGDYSFDNTNYMFSDFFAGGGGGRVPVDNSYDVIRHHFWLSTDRAFKGSVEAISRKRAALRNITQQEKLNDFSKAEPVKLYKQSTKVVKKQAEWTRMMRELSGLFADYPKVTRSQVEMDVSYATSYFVNSEGTELRYPDDLFYVRVRASAQAKDGMPVRDAAVFQSRTLERLPSAQEIRQGVIEVAKTITALTEAPAAEDYSGPVLIEGAASGQLFAQLLGASLGLSRRPVNEPGRNIPLPTSELEGRMGSRILPEWMDVVDDPTQTSYKGHELQGYYPVDMEGVAPKPLTVVEKGSVKNFLMTRLPVRGFEGSNGRARLPGPFGSKAAIFTNLFVQAKESVPASDLKKKLLDMVAQRGKPYGIIIRKLDFPASGAMEEIRRQSTANGQRGGSSRPSSLPTLIYRIYPDGREELVRGLRFRTLNVRTLRDIVAASSEETIFDFIGNGSALPVMGQGGYVSTHTVVAPSVLFEDLELEKREEDWPKLPIVPPPDLLTSR